MSLKSDDSDSFMEYMSMRPRTASDSYNYRPRTSSFGKLQPMCRPRSASHGQGTRPFPKFSKLAVEQSRISQDPMHRTSMESSLQGSFDSLRVSNESLRKTSQEIRKKSGSNASDYAEMRGTPSPQLKLVSSEPDGYVNMQPGTAGRKSSPHRIRSDSSGSGRRPDIRTNSSDRLQQQTHLQQIDDYTEMAPTNVSSGGSRDSYMNMDYGTRQSNISDVKLTGATIPPSLSNDSEYMTMELDSKKSRSDTGRSVSMENVDTYVMYDPSHSAGNKQRTGSLGSKDKQIFRPTSSRKPSSVSMSSCSPSASSVIVQQQPSVSTSTRTGGSSDSIRKASRQSSMEKYSLGKDFRKKSGSTGSRPSSAKLPFSMGKDHNAPGFGIMPVRKPASTSAPVDDLDDEYIEFSPTATKGDSSHPNSHHPTQLHSSVQPSSHPSRGVPFSSSGGFSSAHPLPSPAEEEAYTLYNPAPQFASKTVHFQPQKPPPSKLNIPSSAKQGAAKEAQDYVGFEPGPPIHSVVSPSTSHRKINEAQEYVEYQPATAPGYFTFSPSLQPHESSRADGQEYVGYEPGPVSSQGASKPVSPNSVMSYIKGSSSDLTTGKSKQSQGPKQQQTFSDLSNKTGRGDAAPGKLSPSNSTHKTELPFKEGQIFTFPGNSQWSSPSASSLLSPNAAQPPPVYVTNAQNLQHPGTEKVAQHSNFVNKTNPAPFSSFSTAPPFPVSSKTLTSDPFKDGPHPDTAQQSKQPKAPPLIAGPQTGQQCLPATQSGQQCLPATQSGQQFLPPTQSGQPCLSTTQSSQNCLPSPQSSQKCLPATQSSQRFLPATPSSQPCLSVIQSGQECLSAAQTCTQSQSCSQNTVLNEGNHYVSYNPAQSGSFKSPKEDLAPETPLPSACLLQGAQTFGGAKPSVFTELTIDTGVENSFQGNVNQPQKNSHGYQRQTSAPASTHPSQALDTPKSNPTAQQPQVTSDSTVAEVNKQKNLSGAQTSSNHQPMSPIPSSENSKRHKHLSGSSTSDAPSPSASTNRHKHPSGSSTSSQKSRKASTDSEKSISKGSKSDSRGNNQSDSNSSLNLSGGKTKRRMPSGDKSPGSSAEKSPMSPTRGGGEFFCGEASPVAGKDLEAKMAVVKAKIQQSFGDVSGMVSSTSKDGHGQSLGDMTAACKKDGHGLIRPGSTPCMQSLDAAPDVSRSAGDTPNFSSRSCCLQFSSSSRTRHSIPDLGNYQQINFASSSGLVSTGSEQKVNTSSSNSGSGESCGSTHSEPAFKPLIYVKLDLGGSEGQGDADLKVPRIKSRNSSDADEKQPPLSYAQIDFVKSQNLNKGKSMTMAGGDSSSKS
ncbi:unnamed protein product [Lymnaea stagnalis]|uniref:Uncharacterized protein n=1 Tax=Lymnaea stagnalis TaxID=6523 RepID=A0AAV2HRG4_LYMST